MKILNMVKKNLFAAVIALLYLILLLFRPSTGADAIWNSGYYIKEMLMIMPVVFVLTALLDAWVPREVILKYLGESSKISGAIFSLLLGSVSAGPIYAAFPVCTMLLKKGAAVRNIVIILGSWAVIKIPMLLNEAKFLGPQFMAVRWILTVIAILLMAWIMEKLVKKENMPAVTDTESEPKEGLSLNQTACMGCGLCARICPDAFEVTGKKATVRSDAVNADIAQVKRAVGSCPVKAISCSNLEKGGKR